MPVNIEVNEVNQILFALLSVFNISFEQLNVGNSSIFTVEMFGCKIVYLDGQEFDKKILRGWHVAYIHPDYYTKKAKETIVWGLVKGGYFHYLRENYKKTFQHMLVFEGWDRLLSKERKNIYKELPKHKYLLELIDRADREGASYTLSMDPGFFDFFMR